MTATQQPASPLTGWAKTVIGTFRYVNHELLAAGEAMVRSNRFPHSRPHAESAQASHAHVASGAQTLTRV
jgi:hypothetical protein